jgi:hypothetical protein
MAIQIWVFTLFGEVPRNRLIRKCCLIHFEEEFYLPPFVMKLSDGESAHDEVIGQEDEPPIDVFRIIRNPT